MKRKTTIIISFDELIKRTADEQNLSDSYTFAIDKEKGIITIEDEGELDLPDIRTFVEQSSNMITIASKISASLKGKAKDALIIEDLKKATYKLKNLSRSEKPKLARLREFYEKYSEKKIQDILSLKFSEIKEDLGYNCYGIRSHQVLVTILQTIGFTEDYPFFSEPYE